MYVFFNDDDWCRKVKQNIHLMKENEKTCCSFRFSRQNMHLCRWCIIIEYRDDELASFCNATDILLSFVVWFQKLRPYWHNHCVRPQWMVTLYYEFEWMTMRILQIRVKIRLYALLDIEWYSHFDSLLMLAFKKRSHSIILHGDTR